jgi:hypothetical protein
MQADIGGHLVVQLPQCIGSLRLVSQPSFRFPLQSAVPDAQVSVEDSALLASSIAPASSAKAEPPASRPSALVAAEELLLPSTSGPASSAMSFPLSKPSTAAQPVAVSVKARSAAGRVAFDIGIQYRALKRGDAIRCM